MGWFWYRAKHYKNGKIDRIAEVESHLNYQDDQVKYTVLKSALVGRTVYSAVEKVTSDGKRDVFATVFVTSTNNRDYCNFGYKDMCETMLPYYYDCPKSILGLLTPTNNEYANEWRKRCYENLKNKHKTRKKL